jgi:nucleolar protein 12
VPFQNPTSKLPTASDDESGQKHPKPKSDASSTTKQAREHDRNRASSWRHQKGEEDDDGGKSDEKKFLNPKQKKKIAFINQEFHSTADTVNAYIVFAHPPPVDTRPSNLPPPPPTLDPYEAARLAVERCDSTLFMERMICVDLVSKKSLVDKVSGTGHVGDPKLSVFVGNLDFASKEEDLRVFFEGVVCAERGPPPAGDEDSDNEMDGSEGIPKKPKTWVTRVRIVRDKETQPGKGFAYVQFSVSRSLFNHMSWA